MVFWTPSESSSVVARPLVGREISNEATCDDWASWLPPRTDPAVVLQVVNEPYADLQRNFIRLMELNSGFTRQNLYLLCLDDASVPIFASLGIRCVPLGALKFVTNNDLWKTRVRVVSCLVTKGYDVIMSDSDALWLGDPMEYISLSSTSSVIASRGSYPPFIGQQWGVTLCMGFIMFRATGAAMDIFQNTMARIVLKTGDDQIAVNQAALKLGVVWDKSSDMRYRRSKSFGKGTIADLSTDDGESFEIALLPHNKFTRHCLGTPVTNETMVAHCIHKKNAGEKMGWMQELNLWSPYGSSP